MQQVTDPDAAGYNPYGCCCEYNYGCIDTEGVMANPDPSANQNWGCIDAVVGCMNQAFQDSYDPLANVHDPAMCIISNMCLDDGSNPDYTGIFGDFAEAGGMNPSPWNNYICLDDTPITNMEGAASTIGETLCNCGPGFAEGYMEIGEGAFSGICSAISGFDTSQGTFIDGECYDSTTGTYAYSFENNCSCDEYLIGACLNDPDGTGTGNPTYVYNDGENDTELNIENYNENATEDDGTCLIYGCEDPLALNYFCSSNPDMCIPGDETYPVGHPDEGASIPILNPIINSSTGISTTEEYPCVYGTTYDCVTYYNLEPGQEAGCNENVYGGGTYNSIEECTQNCYNCSRVDAIECNGTNEMTFECLQIDGRSGESNTTQPALFFTEGDFFQIMPDATTPNVTYINDPNAGSIATEPNVSWVDRPDRDFDKEIDEKEAAIWEVITIENEVLENPPPYDLAESAICVDPIYGCTDSTASNYNPNATEDDGSCVYPQWCVDVIATSCNADQLNYCTEPIVTGPYAADVYGPFPGPSPDTWTDVEFKCITVDSEFPVESDYFFAVGVNCAVHGCYQDPDDDDIWVDTWTEIESCSQLTHQGPGGQGKWKHCSVGFDWPGATAGGGDSGASCGQCDPNDPPLSAGPIAGGRGFQLQNGKCCIWNEVPSNNLSPTYYRGCYPSGGNPNEPVDFAAAFIGTTCQEQDGEGISGISNCSQGTYSNNCCGCETPGCGPQNYWVVGNCGDPDSYGFSAAEGACPATNQMNPAGCPAEDGSTWISFPCNGPNAGGCAGGPGPFGGGPPDIISESSNLNKLLTEQFAGSDDCGVNWDYSYTQAWDIKWVSEPYIYDYDEVGGYLQNYPSADNCGEEWDHGPNYDDWEEIDPIRGDRDKRGTGEEPKRRDRDTETQLNIREVEISKKIRKNLKETFNNTDKLRSFVKKTFRNLKK